MNVKKHAEDIGLETCYRIARKVQCKCMKILKLGIKIVVLVLSDHFLNDHQVCLTDKTYKYCWLSKVEKSRFLLITYSKICVSNGVLSF